MARSGLVWLPEAGDAEMVDNIDKALVKALRKHGDDGASTYRLAQDAGVSWVTARSRLYDLKDDGLVGSRRDVVRNKRSIIWWLN